VASHVNLISSPDDRLVCQLARRCGHCNCVRTRRLSCSWSELASCTDGSAMGTVERSAVIPWLPKLSCMAAPMTRP
jgi:hypothetical protein